DDELPLADRALAFNVRRPGFQPDDMLLFQLQFSGVLDGHDTVGVRDVSREDIQQSRFAGAGTARDDDIEPSLDHGREQLEHGFGEGLIFDHLPRGYGIAAEAADRETRAVDGERRNDGIDTGTVGQAGIHHGRRFVDAPSDAGNNALNDLHEVNIV